jgi:membrane protein implicated in regulation of membrane protease activity
MTLPDFFLICFVTGFALSAVSFLASGFHLPHPHLHLHMGHAGAKGSVKSGTTPLNFGTATTFLAWFGGTGYVLTRYWPASLVWILALAIASGLAGAGLVFWFVTRVLSRHEKDLDPADYDMRGVLGRVSSVVRAGGTGEMIFSQEGVRRGAPIRAETGGEIPRGAEVIVTRYEKGIAYVRPWEDSQTEV